MAKNLVILSDAIVLKIVPSGERFHLARLLCPERGHVSVLKRRSNKQSGPTLDLFDQIEASVELKTDGVSGFLGEFTLERKRVGIGASYERLEAASWLSTFLLANPMHAENIVSSHALAKKAFDSLDAGHPPNAVLLKTLFVYSRDEGYPVQQDWAQNLDTALSKTVRHLLNTPLSEISLDPGEQRQAFLSLSRYIEEHTHIELRNPF